MLIEFERWKTVKHLFTYKERDEIREHISVSTLPYMFDVDHEKLSERLQIKLRRALDEGTSEI